jgi:hypothetical protein
MMLLLSGEGPTDIGASLGGGPICEAAQFKPGPMAIIVDRLTEQKIGYSPLDVGAVCFVDEREVSGRSRGLSVPRSPRLPGVKAVRDTLYFRKNAQALGRLARDLEIQRERPVVAVLFHDSDGSNSATRSLWQDKFHSIAQGFEDAEFGCGVPMVPKPKSEAWLLCALKSNSYEDCAALEEESGNDKSPNSLKGQLDAVIGHHASSEDLADWVREGRIDAGRIVMPSFSAFSQELNRALDCALSH